MLKCNDILTNTAASDYALIRNDATYLSKYIQDVHKRTLRFLKVRITKNVTKKYYKGVRGAREVKAKNDRKIL